jgi:peroxidase
LIVFLALLSLSHSCYGELTPGHYKDTCKDLEKIVFGIVQREFTKNATLAPLLIRLYFHDCFSNGCDASLLLDGPSSERKARPNLSVGGYELIDAVKTELEQKCAGVVSCADIIALVTRDLVFLASGFKARYEIPMGRFDSFVSLSSTVDLPGPTMSVSQTADMFDKRNLSVDDMVLLLGGHTIGVTHCSFFKDRLYNFQNTNKPDPSMDPKLAQELRGKCPDKSTFDGTVNLDQDFFSSNVVDGSFYRQIQSSRGILQIDQQIATDEKTSEIVRGLAKGNGDEFFVRFGQAMARLGSVRVKDKNNGEIRKSCRSCNTPLMCATS